MVANQVQAISKVLNVEAIEDIAASSKVVSSVGPNSTPFSQILDSAVSTLSDLNKMENVNAQLTADYVKGRVSLEEVMLHTNQLSVAMQLAVTVVNSGVTTFKEIQQMQV